MFRPPSYCRNSAGQPLTNILDPPLSPFKLCPEMSLTVVVSRLWLTSRDPDEPAGPQQIGFINFIPQCVHEGGYFSGPKFEQFGDALNRMNESLRRQPIQGMYQPIQGTYVPAHTGYVLHEREPAASAHIHRVYLHS